MVQLMKMSRPRKCHEKHAVEPLLFSIKYFEYSISRGIISVIILYIRGGE